VDESIGANRWRLIGELMSMVRKRVVEVEAWRVVVVDRVENCIGECWLMIAFLFGTVSVVSDRRLECARSV
jgi:hypothetical protein